jgi:Uma2 family endonuclease
MSHEQFLTADFENPHVGWVNGSVVEMHQVTSAHQDTPGFLLAAVLSFAEEKQLGRILSRPFQMKTAPNLPGRSPDLFFISKARRNRVKKMFLNGPADLFWSKPLPSTLSILRLWGLI